MGEELFYYKNGEFVEGVPDYSILEEDERSPATVPPEDEEQDTAEE
jgi:hypothetical protein